MLEKGYIITEEIYLDFYKANTKEKVEKLLAKNGLKNDKEKTKFLEQIMGVQKSFNAVSQNNSVKEYDVRLAKFLEGSWRSF